MKRDKSLIKRILDSFYKLGVKEKRVVMSEFISLYDEEQKSKFANNICSYLPKDGSMVLESATITWVRTKYFMYNYQNPLLLNFSYKTPNFVQTPNFEIFRNFVTPDKAEDLNLESIIFIWNKDSPFLNAVIYQHFDKERFLKNFQECILDILFEDSTINPRWLVKEHSIETLSFFFTDVLFPAFIKSSIEEMYEITLVLKEKEKETINKQEMLRYDNSLISTIEEYVDSNKHHKLIKLNNSCLNKYIQDLVINSTITKGENEYEFDLKFSVTKEKRLQVTSFSLMCSDPVETKYKEKEMIFDNKYKEMEMIFDNKYLLIRDKEHLKKLLSIYDEVTKKRHHFNSHYYIYEQFFKTVLEWKN